MKSFSRFVLLCLLGLVSIPVSGQVGYYVHEVKGVVIDSLTSEPLAGAFVTVINRAGSYHMVADKEGKFSLKVIKDGDAMKVEVAFLGYRLLQQYFVADRKKIDVGTLRMVTDPQEIDAVIVEGRRILFKQNGDTLVYFPSNVYVREGSSALDMLKKMPNVEVEDDMVKVQGKRVERTYVNGRLIFGKDNPMHALNYLDAKDISRVLAYDEYDEQSALAHGKHGRKRRVLNLLTFDLFDQSFNINTLAGVGADLRKDEEGKHRTRYMLGTDMAFFKEGRTILADYSLQNALGVEPGAQPAYKYYSGGDAGYERQQSVGVEYSGKLAPRWDIRGKYSYNDSYTRDRQITQDQYFGGGTDFARVYYDSLMSRNQSDVHHGYLKVENMTQRVITTIEGNVTSGKTMTTDLSSNRVDLQDQIFSRLSNDNRMQKQSTSFDLSAKITAKVGKGSIEASVSGALADADLDQERREDSLMRIGNKIIQTAGTGRSRDLSGQIQYSLNSSNAGSFSVGYRTDYHYSRDRTLATDMYSGEIDSTLTRNYTDDYWSNTLLTGYKFNKDKWSLGVGLDLEYKTVGRDDVFPAPEKLNKTFRTLLPYVDVSYAFAMLNSLHFSYSTSSQSPSLEMLRNKLDYDNPLYLTAGNPNLKRGYVHNLSLWYTKSNVEKQAFLTVGAEATVTSDMIGTKNTLFTEGVYLPQYEYTTVPGSVLTSYDNVGKGVDCRANFSYYWQINFLKCIGGVSGVYEFSKLPMYAGDTRIDRTQHSPNMSVSLESNFSDNIEFKIYNQVTYLFSRGLAGQEERSLNNLTMCSVAADFLKRMFGSVAYNFYMDHSYTGKDNRISNHMLNATIGIRFMKDRKGTLSVTAYDLLNRNKSFVNKVFADHVSNVWNSRSAGFFLFAFTYKFNRQK